MGQVGSSTALTGVLIDPKTGRMTWAALKLFQNWQKQLAAGFDTDGNLISDIEPGVKIIGRDGTIGAILQNIDQNGVVLPAGMTAATDTEQGAVILADGATSNKLGTAATADSTSFDPAGAAAAAQGAAESYAAAAAGTAQTNAENAASTALTMAFAPGISGTIVTAALTSGGAQGSMTFQNGLLTASTPAT